MVVRGKRRELGPTRATQRNIIKYRRNESGQLVGYRIANEVQRGERETMSMGLEATQVAVKEADSLEATALHA